MKTDIQLIKLVMSLTSWNQKKVTAWFKKKNLLIGDITPNRFIELCGKPRLEEFIKSRTTKNLALTTE